MSRVSPIVADFTGGELSPRLDGRANTDLYGKGCKTIDNFMVLVHGGVQKRPGSRYISTVKHSDKETRLIPYIYGENTSYVLEFGDNYMRVYTNGGQVQTSGIAYEIATPYADTDIWDLKFVQSADVMYFSHPDYAPQKLIRYADDVWTIGNVPFVNGPFMDENTVPTYYISTSNTTGNITATASGFSPFTADHVGSNYRLTGTIRETTIITTSGSWTNSIEADAYENLFIELTGTWVATVTVQRSTNAGATWVDVVYYTSNVSSTITEYEENTIYRIGVKPGNFTSGSITATIGKLNQYGYFEITHYTSPTQVSGTVKKTLPTTGPTTNWSEGSWSDANGFPRAIAFFEEKLVFAGTYTESQTLWFSQTDDYENYEAGVTLADALTVTLASNNINIIQWLLDSQEVLHIGTIGSEWNIETQEAFPFITASRQSTFGSNYIQGIPVGQLILYIQKGGKKLRQRYYSYEPDTWLSNEISTISEHLFRDGVYDLTYIDDPDPILLMTRSDGKIVGCTFDSSNKIIAYYTWSTNGNYRNVTSIPGTERDEIWYIVERTTNSGVMQFVEQQQTTNWDALEDAWYLDSAIPYVGAPNDTFTGLGHLEGLGVVTTVSGAVLPEETVVSGSITVDDEYPDAIVGLAYEAKLQTMSLEAGADFGTSQTRYKAISKLAIRLYKTVGLQIGATEDLLDIIPFRASSDIMGAPPALFTGDKFIQFPKGFGEYITVWAVSEQPTPCTILALIPTIRTNDY